MTAKLRVGRVCVAGASHRKKLLERGPSHRFGK